MIKTKGPAYIPSYIKEMTEEEHVRAELSRYHEGEALERGIIKTLRYFNHLGDIKEYDYCEEYVGDFGLASVKLVWKQRLPLQ